jgi:hypothetical protein
LLDDWRILQRHSVVLLGADATTGFGKSSFAAKLAACWSMAAARGLGVALGDTRVCLSNTLDDLRPITFQRSWSLVLDEFSIADEGALQYFSENIAKVLFDPSCAANIRARGSNARLSPDTARIMTSNASSLEEWAGGRIPFSLPLRRKLICFVIREPLVPVAWSRRADYRHGEW